MLDSDQLAEGEQIVASPAVSNGRIYLVSTRCDLLHRNEEDMSRPNAVDAVDKKAPGWAPLSRMCRSFPRSGSEARRKG